VHIKLKKLDVNEMKFNTGNIDNEYISSYESAVCYITNRWFLYENVFGGCTGVLIMYTLRTKRRIIIYKMLRYFFVIQ